ncbi:MAG TPA: DUF4159 domain-containing protein [Opitutaceae bacterium]|nr:DUF4159 domain-containing protein [Opitutaceae bacterium]
MNSTAPCFRGFAAAAVTDRRCRFGIFAMVLLVCGVVSSRAADEPRGGRVGWARIITSSKEWDRHAGSDPMLTKFIRQQTSLNIDPTWYSANPASVDELCKYPLLYTNNLTDVTDPAHRKNLQEYLQRGGFILVDACINPGVTPDPDVFLEQHTALMKILAPGAEVWRLPNDHDVYRQYFPMKDTPPRQFMNDVFDKRWAKHGLYGAFQGGRMISIITLSGLQCSWSSHPERAHAKECMKMIVNIYVHTMTR